MKISISGRSILIALLFTVSMASAWSRTKDALGPRAAKIPKFSHVLIVVIENKEFGDVIGNPRMPNFNRWASEYALLTQYYAITHPSLPNYLALISGDFFGIQSNCVDCFVDGRSLPDLLEASGRSWKAYLEGLPEAGFLGSYSGKYAMKHNPFVYFNAIRKDPGRLTRSVVRLAELADDLDKNALPDYAFVVPNMCNSSHDCGLEVADAWLGGVVGSILESPAFDASSLLVLTFDEGATDRGSCGLAKGGWIATILISPLVKRGFKDAAPYSHYSLLKTILRSWGLGDLGHTADPTVSLIVSPWRDR
jgi:hypothetical protein